MFDLQERSGLERLAHAADHRRPDPGHVSCLGPDDQVEVALAYPGLRIGEPSVLVGQRPRGLAGDDQGLGPHRELAAPRGAHLTGDADVVSQVDGATPQVMTLGADGIEAHHHLQVPTAVAEGGEAEGPVVALEQHPAGHGYAGPGPGVRGELPCVPAYLAQEVRTRVGRRIRVDALGPEPLELGPPDPHLLGHGRRGHRHRGGSRRRDQGEHRGRVLQRPTAERAALVGTGTSQQPRQRRPREETLGVARGHTHPRQVRGVLEAEEPGLPAGLVLGVRAVQGLQLPVPAGEKECLPPEPRDRPGSELLAPLEGLAEHREVQRDPRHPETGVLVGQGRDHELHDPVVGRGIAAHEVQRQAVLPPRHEAQEAPERAVGVARGDQDAAAVEGVLDATQGHGEAPLVTAVTAPVGCRGGELDEGCRIDVLVPPHGGGVTTPLQPADRRADGLEPRAVEGERLEVEDGLVAQLEGVEPGPGVGRGAGRTRAHHRQAETGRAGLFTPPRDRSVPGIRIPDRVATGQADRAERAVGHAGPGLRGVRVAPHHRLVPTGREVAQGVMVTEVTHQGPDPGLVVGREGPGVRGRPEEHEGREHDDDCSEEPEHAVHPERRGDGRAVGAVPTHLGHQLGEDPALGLRAADGVPEPSDEQRPDREHHRRSEQEHRRGPSQAAGDPVDDELVAHPPGQDHRRARRPRGRPATASPAPGPGTAPGRSPGSPATTRTSATRRPRSGGAAPLPSRPGERRRRGSGTPGSSGRRRRPRAG